MISSGVRREHDGHRSILTSSPSVMQVRSLHRILVSSWLRSSVTAWPWLQGPEQMIPVPNERSERNSNPMLRLISVMCGYRLTLNRPQLLRQAVRQVVLIHQFTGSNPVGAVPIRSGDFPDKLTRAYRKSDSLERQAFSCKFVASLLQVKETKWNHWFANNAVAR